jgi:hypothetical protein
MILGVGKKNRIGKMSILQIVGILAGQEQKNYLYGAIIQSSGDD